MLDSFKKIYQLLEARARRRAALLSCMILVLGFLEMVGVGSIMPFVAVLADPKIVETNRYLSVVYNQFGFANPQQFLFVLGIAVFLVVLSSAVFKALTSWVTFRFTRQQRYALSLRLFQRYLHQPYEWFLGRHSSDLGRTVLSEVNEVIGGVLSPAMRLITQTVVAAFLVALLIAVDPLLAVIIVVIFGGAYGLIMWASHHYVRRIGASRLDANRERFRISNEALAGIKDIKILGLEDTFLRRFQKPSRRLARDAGASQMIAQLPQYALQVISLSTIMLIVLYQLQVHGGLGQSLPVIAVYVLAGQRLQPAFQQIYLNITNVRFNMPALDLLHRDLVGEDRASQEGVKARLPEPNHQLELRDVTYCYPGATSPALRDASLAIPARTTVGLVGETGAGKTTAVDVILGLLEPTRGELLVDGTAIGRENRRAWQNCVGYVPQNIFLSDDTVAANIAFGIPYDRIEMAAVERAARIANLHRFVTEELNAGYETLIGERGIRLSGGQRQRIGIARALYRDPDVVIMDEATSALDNITERVVMDAVRNLAHQKTIILIAHRLTTVRRCDTIFLLERGRVVANGTYDELANKNEHFRAMIESAVS